MLFGKRVSLNPTKAGSARKRAVQTVCRWLILSGLAVLALLTKDLAQDPQSKPVSQIAPYVLSAQADPQAVSTTLKPGLPLRLIIEKIKVSAPVENVGLTQSGDMGVPSQANKVGWYEHGPRPGELGAAVLDGHVDGMKGEPDIFADLHKLQKGDTFQVIDDTGTTSSFVITDTRTYNQEEKPAEVFTASVGMHVNLITCAGAWDKKQHRFTKRLVVFGEKVL